MKVNIKNNFSKIDLFLLVTILVVAFSLRLYKINTPLADLHSWRQVDTAAVAKNFVRDGFDLLHPRYDDLTSIESGKENPQGYRFVEFPFYNAVFARLYKLYPFYPIEVYGRLTSIFFSLIIIGVIYYLCLKESSRLTAVFSSTVYAIFPFFVFFSRIVVPETTATSLTFLAIFFLYLWHKHPSLSIIYYLSSIICFALALLTKPTVIFYSVSLLYIFWMKYRFTFIKNIWPYLFFGLSIIPLLLWRNYIQNFPEGIPASTWLLTNVNTFEGQKNIFFRPAFFRWIFLERINNYIFGGYLTVLFILGIISKTKKYLLFSLLLSAFAYIFVFQGGNVQHEYYQTLILPILAIFVGLGINFIVENNKRFFHPLLSYSSIVVLIIFSWLFSYYNVKNYYNYPNDLIQIAKVISTLTNRGDKIITDRTGDTTLLYLADRKGSPAVYKSLEEFKNDNYQYLVTANKESIENIKQQKIHQIIFENDQFSIIKL